MKTFKDLHFKDHELKGYIARYSKGICKQARLQFENGYSVSVLIGDLFYSNGLDTYELAVLDYKGDIYYGLNLKNDDVFGYITEDEVTKYMIEVQKL